MAGKQGWEDALEALRAEHAVYVQILAVSKQQLQVAKEGRVEELLGIVVEKGKMTDVAAGLALRSRSIKEHWADAVVALSLGEVSSAGELLQGIASLLSEIIECENACQKEIGDRRDGVLDGILRVQMGRKAVQAYGQQAPQRPRFKDERK
jgi:hypothetical protein